MKKFILFLVLFSILTTRATTLYDQLCSFNPNWKDYADRAPKGEAIQFESDQAYIQTHLKAVISILKSNRISGLNKEQKRTRKKLINELESYCKAGLFPKNYYRSARTPVFIDEHGTHCAVGYLLMKTGHDDIALRIAETNNYAWVKEIKNPDLFNWQKESGFTLAELKLIQGAYDSYLDNAMFLWNRYEIPQRPAVIEAYFPTDKLTGERKIWCYGEGEDGVLDGKWIQNYSEKFPWIIGFYENGKRTGKWAEYYQGTNQLCRTEHWCDDQLNGVRTRFNREGEIIEEIIFKDGQALLKTNYDLDQGLRWERTPIDSNLVFTKVFNNQNTLIAKGKEEIYNPGNLLWFQDIELTVLNSISIASRDNTPNFGGALQNFQSPPLVNYAKNGDWIYYRDLVPPNDSIITQFDNTRMIAYHFHEEISAAQKLTETYYMANLIDSVKIGYHEDVAISYEEFQIHPIYIDFPRSEVWPWPDPRITICPPPYSIFPIGILYTYIIEIKDVPSYESLKAWENAKMGLFVFRQPVKYYGKKEDPPLIAQN